MTKMLIDRSVVGQALEALAPWMDSDHTVQHAAYHALRAALAQQAEPVEEQDAELSAALGWPGGISNPVLDRKVLLQKVAALMQDKLWEDHRVRHLWDHTLAQQAEPVDTDCHTQGICQRSGYGIGKQADPQIEDRLARHGINPCPDCRGIGYDASGQLCWCQQNPSF